MRKLYKRAHHSGVWTGKVQRKYDSIDKETSQIMMASKEKCVPKFRYPIPWSHTKKANEIRYWNISISKLTNEKIFTAIKAQTLRAAKIKYYTVTLKDAKSAKLQAKKKLRSQLKEANKIREEELQEKKSGDSSTRRR